MTYKRANFGAAIARQQRRQGYHPRGGGSSGEAASHLRDALLTRALPAAKADRQPPQWRGAASDRRPR
jgi:uncharacterized SAM-binding protein YcdF (DUF218 family)